MTLHEFIVSSGEDFADYDTYDSTYDACITVVSDTSEDTTEPYDKFCDLLLKKVNFVRKASDSVLVCNWSQLIQENFELFKKFSRQYWSRSYDEDDEEFVFQWLCELQSYLAGYVTDSIYLKLIELLDSITTSE